MEMSKKKISGLINKETRGPLRNFLATAICDAMTYTEHIWSMTAIDVVYAHKRAKQAHQWVWLLRDILRVLIGFLWHGGFWVVDFM